MEARTRPVRRMDIFRIFSVFVLCLIVGLLANLTFMQRLTAQVWKGSKMKEPPVDRVWKEKERKPAKKVYEITWYNPNNEVKIYPDALYGDFESCRYDNCIMKFDKQGARKSDAVLFDGRAVKHKDYFTKKPGQVWIFAAAEAPVNFHFGEGDWMKGEWLSSFNWTMTYDQSNTDIFLPYGEIRKIVQLPKKVNYSEIFHMKNKTAVIIHSHCNPPSERGKYLELLGKYIEIDSLGQCGKPWNCGKHYIHDDCFNMINNYKFYLAFENSFCDQYFTEKVFQNFNYDSLMVIRGGRNNDSRRIFPPGTYISTDDFHSVKELANYLNKVANSEEMYVKILKEKNMYYSIPFEMVYQRAMCQLCDKMNKQDEYRKEIPNISEWAYGRKPCQKAQDLIET